MFKRIKLSHESLFWLFFVISIILPFIIYIKPIIGGNLPFWNDPSRDLLMAWDNLKKPTLIGPTSGIPGIFYGPQWIWLLSFGLIFSKDPRFVSFLIIALPYFVIIPYFLYLLSKKLLSQSTVIVVWLLLIFFLGRNLNNIWSPNLAPLFFFCIIAFLYRTDLIWEKKNITSFFILGFLQGLLLNHHISFGVGITVSWVLYFLTAFIISLFGKSKLKSNLWNWFINCLCFGSGFLLILSPFFLFEIRHGFSQIKSLFFTLNQAYVHNSTVVGQIGLAKNEIVQKFIERLPELLSIPKNLSTLFLVALIVGLAIVLVKERKINKNKISLFLFLFFNVLGVLMIYLTSKNPVWNYHFIGVEIIYLFLIALLINKNKALELIGVIWVILLLVINSYSFLTNNNSNRKVDPELVTKKINVERIYQDAGGQPFGYLAKNSAIYTFDYDYIFRWLSKKYGYLPEITTDNVKVIYLIIPEEFESDVKGFTDNRTSEMKYRTVSQWYGVDRTLIIKRELR